MNHEIKFEEIINKPTVKISPLFETYKNKVICLVCHRHCKISLTFSTWSCNFDCPWCQNYHISKVKSNPYTANYVDPKRLIDIAIKNGDQGFMR